MGKTIKITHEQLKNQSEIIRVKNNEVILGVAAFSGKEGDIYLVYSPSLEISGYGDTPSEADKSFELNLTQFCEDFHKLSSAKRDLHLKGLGWKQVKYKRKNYSKSYIDTDGVLQNFEEGTVECKFFEAVA